MLKLTANVLPAKRYLRMIRDEDVPFATAAALTLTAKDVQAAEVQEMKRVFDRPTPFTLNGTFVKTATVKSQEARVWLKDFAAKGTPAVKYLAPQVFGGYRRFKRFEWALRKIGAMPPGYYAMPGEGARLNAYGNITPGQIVQILSVLGGAEMRAGYQANRTARSAKRNRKPRDYFVVGPGNEHNLEPGVYERKARGIAPVLIYVRKAAYEVRYDFHGVALATSNRLFAMRVRDAVAKQLLRRARLGPAARAA